MKNNCQPGRRNFFVACFSPAVVSLIICFVSTAYFDTAFAQLPSYYQTAGVQKKPACVSKKPDGSYEISNFRWGFDTSRSAELTDPVWRTVKLDSNAVSDVFFCLRPFPPCWLASHAFLYFEFREGAHIVSTSGEKARGMVLSIEPLYPAGKTYGSPMRGGPYFIVYQLSAIDDYLQICEKTNTRIIRSFKLKLTAATKKKLLEKTLESSFNCNFPKYDLLMNNCINNIFVLFNSILPDELRYRKNYFGTKFWNPNVSTPQLCVNAIKNFGLLDGKEPEAKFFISGTSSTAHAPLTGEALKKALADHKDMQVRIGSIQSLLFKGIDDGKITAEELKDMYYNEMAGYVPYLYIPPTDPETGRGTEFKIGEEFLEGVSSGDAKGYLRTVFNNYSKAIHKRLTANGPDAKNFINGNINEMKKAVEKASR